MEVHGATESKKQRRYFPKRRVFTLELANRALPLVQRIVSDIVDQYKRVAALEEQCETVDHAAGSDAGDALRDRYGNEIERLRELARELTDIGVELKDWRRGLVDFLSLHNGREVYLCWRLGESKIEYWHDLEAGFPGRQPIDATFVA